MSDHVAFSITRCPSLQQDVVKPINAKTHSITICGEWGDLGYPKETMGYYFYFPPENKIVVARSARTHRAPDRLCLNVEVEEHSLGDLNEPANYKAAILDLEFDKWLDAINAEMQSMKDKQVWCLVDLTPNLGSIMYAVRCTRPDVAFVQNITSRFQQNPGELHWVAMKTILKYLRNTKDMFLVYGRNPEAELRVDCYCDAGFKTGRDDTKSQT
nr:retrotransposon protein, putative, Ty1-copia subclass [Tanacetum cinerariifolium]